MIMTTKQKELYDVIESLPEELSTKVIDYIEYLKFSYMTKAPEDLIIKDDKDLLKKLKKGMEDTANGKVCSVEEAYEEVKELAFSRDLMSINYIIRSFGVGFNRAGKLFSMLVKEGIVEDNGSNTKASKVLVHSQEELNDKMSGEI